MEKLLLYFVAVIPGIAMAFYIYFRDKYEPEPVKLLVVSFLLGVLSFGLSIIFDRTLESWGVGMTELVLKSFLEELLIFIILMVLLYRNKNFNEPLDGIVYAIMVAMGFAIAKNVYSVYSYDEPGMIWNMVSSILARASYAVLMGYLLGKAKFIKERETWYIIAALVLATLFHIVYDIIQLLSLFSGIWIGSIAALLIIIILGKQAVDTYQKASPFKKLK